MVMYAVRDTQADATMRPVFFEKDAIALRSFILSVSNADDPMNKTPVDFTLYRIGEYDDEKMLLTGNDPTRLMNGLEAVSQRQFDLDSIQALHKEIEQIKQNGTEPIVGPEQGAEMQRQLFEDKENAD